MPSSTARESVEPCVWMSANLLDYKLCVRYFECERCPLDAALRGESQESASRRPLLGPSLSCIFPDDRLYSSSHIWLQQIESDRRRVLRLGVDTFAAAIIGQCSGVNCKLSHQALRPHETVCEIDLGLGLLPLGTPVCGLVLNGNRALQRDPSRLVTEPYSQGWILDLVVDDTAELPEMLSADAAREQAGLDLRRFRRRVALQLFAATSVVGPSLADGGELLTDLRQMLGGPSYLELLRDLVH